MDVCPKCHNQIVYGMNCCTGKRVLNIMPPQELPAQFPCKICGWTSGHDEFRHEVLDRIAALEKEVADLKNGKA